jgi:trehalose-6-phosphatase
MRQCDNAIDVPRIIATDNRQGSSGPPEPVEDDVGRMIRMRVQVHVTDECANRVTSRPDAIACARCVRAELVEGPHIMAIGDDRTDEDLFRARPASSATVVVGDRPSFARFRAADYREVRQILHSLAHRPGPLSR